MSNKQWEDLQFLTFDQKMVPIYKRNLLLQKRYRIYEVRNASVERFDFTKDFVELNRLPDAGSGKTRAHGFSIGNNIGYKINMLKQIPEKMTSGLCVINFNTPLERDNFTTWAYSSKDKTNLANELLYGLHLITASDICSMAIPQIDWETISDDELWREGKYDKAVLKAMGFTEEDIEKLMVGVLNI